MFFTLPLLLLLWPEGTTENKSISLINYAAGYQGDS